MKNEKRKKLEAAGWKIWLQPDAVVLHAVVPERCRAEYYRRRLWWQGVSRARAGGPRLGLALRMLVALPVRLALFAATRDRVYLYRAVYEPAGCLRELLRPRA